MESQDQDGLFSRSFHMEVLVCFVTPKEVHVSTATAVFVIVVIVVVIIIILSSV